jgi:hypothetical protein
LARRFVLMVVVAAAAAMASFGIASAAGGLNQGSSSPQAVPATPAGMPPTAQVLFAVVNSNGTLARGFGATGVVREAAGVYRVAFRQTISGCAFTGTIGLAGNVGVSPPGEIQVVTANVSPAQVFVTTTNSAGAFADRGFHLHVAC